MTISAGSDEALCITKIAGLTWDQWNARLAMPLLNHLREGKSPLVFGQERVVCNLAKNGTLSLVPNIAVDNTTSNPSSPWPTANNGTEISANKRHSSDQTPTNLNKSGGSGGGGDVSQDEGIVDGLNGSFGYPCGDCGRIYKLKSSLRNHQKWECGKEPQFQCPLCVYRAKQKMHILRHMGRMHKGTKITEDEFSNIETEALQKMEDSVINVGL